MILYICCYFGDLKGTKKIILGSLIIRKSMQWVRVTYVESLVLLLLINNTLHKYLDYIRQKRIYLKLWKCHPGRNFRSLPFQRNTQFIQSISVVFSFTRKVICFEKEHLKILRRLFIETVCLIDCSNTIGIIRWPFQHNPLSCFLRILWFVFLREWNS